MPRKCCSMTPGLSVTELGARQRQRGQGEAWRSPRLPAGRACRAVRTASGISKLRIFWVGALPEVDENEPNNDFAHRRRSRSMSPSTAWWITKTSITSLVEAKKGERITAEIEGDAARLHAFRSLCRHSGHASVSSWPRRDDAPLLDRMGWPRSWSPQTAPTSIQVRESAYGGNGDCLYRLHVGTFPRPTAVLPAGGKPGETLEVRWLGDVGGRVQAERSSCPRPPWPKFGLFAQDDGRHLLPRRCRFAWSILAT